MSQCILVVDDEEDIRNLIRRSLELERYEVWEAPDGRQALNCVESRQPDLVLLDVNIPFLDGFTVCQRIRDLGLKIPVIMLTGNTHVDFRVRGLDCGADDYVGKPFDVPELMARVRAHLRRTEEARSTAQDLIRRKWEEINEGLMLAQSIQQPFRLNQRHEGVHTAVQYLPVGRIGGDFYNILGLPDGRTVFLIGDAVGKGLGASLLMASTFSLLVKLLRENPSPAAVFEAANRCIKADFVDISIYVAAFLAIWDPATERLTYCNAGHQSPMLFRRGGGLRPGPHASLTSNGFFLGAFDEGGYEEREIHLAAGDRILFFTDGLADLRDGSGNAVDIRRIYRRMLKHWHLPVGQVVEALLDSFGGLAEGGVTMRDDLTAMLIEIA
ncbi:MAG: fused response regulator/phosphatase [Armatimonadetes bacterium]|nr:fused response regulator/phosphatase [Armatimonadota bacterium]